MSEKLSVDKLSDIIENYPCRYKQGFTHKEIVGLLDEYSIESDLFYEKLGVNSSLSLDGQRIIYHCDVKTSLMCILENRGKNNLEWD
jgi:hypothetical protein